MDSRNHKNSPGVRKAYEVNKKKKKEKVKEMGKSYNRKAQFHSLISYSV
jgi:inosine/xanthosine triphosphate pyrophosphatase family protein